MTNKCHLCGILNAEVIFHGRSKRHTAWLCNGFSAKSEALERFALLSKGEKKVLTEKAKHADTKEEMQQIVEGIINLQNFTWIAKTAFRTLINGVIKTEKQKKKQIDICPEIYMHDAFFKRHYPVEADNSTASAVPSRDGDDLSGTQGDIRPEHNL